MADKLSKSDLPDQPHAEFWDWHNRMPKSQHFANGTRVQSNNRAGTIEEITEFSVDETVYKTLLTVLWDDGSVSHIKPFALNPTR